MRADFEGGQTPLYRRIPKRGFNHPVRREYAIVNVEQLESLNESEITPDLLFKRGVIKNLGSGLKVLGRGTLKRKLKVEAHRFSAGAQRAIVQAGGEAVLIKNS